MALRNTRAKVTLSPTDIHQILDLPKGLQVLYVGGEFDPPRITVVVHGDHLLPVPEGAELPFLHGSLERELVAVNGKVYSRWAWSPLDDGDLNASEALAAAQVSA